MTFISQFPNILLLSNVYSPLVQLGTIKMPTPIKLTAPLPWLGLNITLYRCYLKPASQAMAWAAHEERHTNSAASCFFCFHHLVHSGYALSLLSFCSAVVLLPSYRSIPPRRLVPACQSKESLISMPAQKNPQRPQPEVAEKFCSWYARKQQQNSWR